MSNVFIIFMIVICIAGIIYLLKESEDRPRTVGFGEMFSGCLGGCMTFVVISSVHIGIFLWLFF